MNYFFETQPNPNPLSYFAHPAPESWHKFETFGNHVVELICPFLSFIPLRGAALTNGFFQILFQTILISTGNLSFLNWLTMLPSIWFFDDQIWSRFFGSKTLQKIRQMENVKEDPNDSWQILSKRIRIFTSVVIGGMLAYLSVPIVQVHFDIIFGHIFGLKKLILVLDFHHETSMKPFCLTFNYGHWSFCWSKIILDGSKIILD